MAETSILDRISTRRDQPDPRSSIEDDGFDDHGAFGWLRGVRDRAVMLELRKRDGSVVAFSYSWLERAEFDPSGGILLKFGHQEVRIVGSNLNKEPRPNVQLFAGIVRHRVPWVLEDAEWLKTEGSIEIERIQIA